MKKFESTIILIPFKTFVLTGCIMKRFEITIILIPFKTFVLTGCIMKRFESTIILNPIKTFVRTIVRRMWPARSLFNSTVFFTVFSGCVIRTW